MHTVDASTYTARGKNPQDGQRFLFPDCRQECDNEDATDWADLLHSSTMSTEQQEQSAEDRIGSMIGKIFVLALAAFLLWGYSTTLLAKLGLF